MPRAELTDAELSRLRTVMVAAGYTVDGVAGALSPTAHAALGRGERVPALRETDGDDRPLATLVRLMLLGTAEPPAAVAAALGGLPVDRAVEAGLLAAAPGGALRAALDVRPYGDPSLPWYVVSDQGSGAGRGDGMDGAAGAIRADHVLGVGGASLTLAHATVRRPVSTALDVGTGCGVQALHLSTHAAHVVATDSNPRALALARMTAALSATAPWELVEGDLLAPVRERRFDLVVSNPPFVVGPSARFAYRDSGLPGDEVSRQLVTGAPELLADGGIAVLLANWLHRAGEPWDERVRGWLDGAGCDALAVQREMQDPAEYAELWLRDGGEHGGGSGTAAYERLYGEWLDWFAAERIEAVGFGIVVLRRTGARPASVRVEHLPQPLEPPLGPVLDGWLRRVDALRGADLLRLAPAVAPGVRLDQRATAGAGGWEVVEQSLVQTGGLRRSGAVDGFGAALLAGCDGTVPLGALVPVLAAGYGLDADEVLPGVLAAVRELAEQGFLVIDAPRSSG
ncbi:MAG: methyltransferase [Frankiaceae bacterium]